MAGSTRELFSLPTTLLALQRRGESPAWVALDTETSGLFADDGARTSTVSVAWPDPNHEWEAIDGITWAEEEIVPGYVVPIASIAWPFDQGLSGKAESHGADLLPGMDADNLSLEEWMALQTWCLEVGDITMHNAPFDIEKMRVGVRRFNEEHGFGGANLIDCVTYDTQNVNDLLWGWERTSLKPTCARLWPERHLDDEAAKVKEYLRKHRLPTGRWDLMPWDIVGPYADLDARLTVMLRLRQEYAIEHQGAASWHGPPTQVRAKAERRLETSKVLTRMTERGLPYHEELSYRAAEMAREVMAGLASKFPYDPAKDADVKAYYFGSGRTSRGESGLDRTPYAMTSPSAKHPDGQPSLTAEVLGRMVADDLPWASEYAAYQRVATAESMWYRGYADKVGADGRLRTYFRQNGTRSTRFSVERVQLQAIPQDYRFSGVAALAGIPTPRDIIRAAVAEFYPGWGLFSLDLAQAELRIASLYAGEQKMIEMIKAGEDLHGYTTTELFGTKKGDPDWDEKRGVGKRGNFSLCFGSGATTFQMMLAAQAGIRWDLDQCDYTVRGWRRLYPAFVGSDGRGGAVARHSRVVERRMQQNLRAGGPGIGWLSFKNHERRWFQPYEEAHKAFNQRVQGDQAQYGVDWLIATDALLRASGFDNPQKMWQAGFTGKAGLLLPIHDSQELLLPLDGGRVFADKCADRGRELWNDWFPGMPGEIEVKQW